MKTSNLCSALVASAALLGAGAASANSLAFDFELLPAATITGAPGATIGWGYTIRNLSNDWLMPLSLDAGVFDHADVTSLFDFPIIRPGDTLSVPYGGGFGLFELTWHGDAPLGFENEGEFLLTAEFYDGDPLTGGALRDALQGSAEYSAIVRENGGPVPEPGTIALLLTGLAGLGLSRRRRAN